MATTAKTSDLTCCLCGQIYTNPVLLSPCSHSFDLDCIRQHTICPTANCRTPVFPQSLLPNIALKNIVDHRNQLAQCTYEIFLLDTSTSMWYSDFFINLIGTSRLEVALKFLREIFRRRCNSSTNQISFITFDTSPLEQFSFETITERHFEILKKLRATGKSTALFDAIKLCLEKFQKLTEITVRSTSQCLYILTDGDDNFSSSGNRQHYIDFIKKRSKELNITGHIIQVGDKNLPSTKDLCDQIDYHFRHFNNGNAPEFTQSFASLSNHYTSSLSQAIIALPDPCTDPVQPRSIDEKPSVLG